MVEERITDGRRIAELLASEIDGRDDGELDRFAVTNAVSDVEPTADGARAYDVMRDGDDATRDGERFARTYVHPDRVRLEFETAQGAAATAAEEYGLRVRPTASRPPRTLVFVESGAEVKRATDVVVATSEAIDDESA